MVRRRVKNALKSRFPRLGQASTRVRARLNALADALLGPEPVRAPVPDPAPTARPLEPEAPPPQPAASNRPAEPTLDRAAIQQVLDDMVRPALQSDGGDIELVRIEGNDLYVSLVGACRTCPSALVTMRMGVERLLKEEFPTLGEVIQVENPSIA